MSEVIKPCPFCGSDDGMPFIRPGDRWRYIQCVSCMCNSGARPTLELAIIAWNQRDIRNKNTQTNGDDCRESGMEQTNNGSAE